MVVSSLSFFQLKRALVAHATRMSSQEGGNTGKKEGYADRRSCFCLIRCAGMYWVLWRVSVVGVVRGIFRALLYTRTHRLNTKRPATLAGRCCTCKTLVHGAWASSLGKIAMGAKQGHPEELRRANYVTRRNLLRSETRRTPRNATQVASPQVVTPQARQLQGQRYDRASSPPCLWACSSKHG